MAVLMKVDFKGARAFDSLEKRASTDRIGISLNQQYHDEPVAQFLPDRRPGELGFDVLSQPQAIFCLTYGD